MARYALQAFGVNSIDYLLKPIEQAQLDRALDKIERLRGGMEPRQEIRELLDRLSAVAVAQLDYPARIASRIGERVELIVVMTHFFAADKLNLRRYAGEELRHRSHHPGVRAEAGSAKVRQDSPCHAGKSGLGVRSARHVRGTHVVRLKDEKKTELAVSRDRVKALKQRLGSSMWKM